MRKSKAYEFIEMATNYFNEMQEYVDEIQRHIDNATAVINKAEQMLCDEDTDYEDFEVSSSLVNYLRYMARVCDQEANNIVNT